LQCALEIREQQLGANHPDTARSLNDVAVLYKEQGKYIEAEPLLVRALAICENILGQNHPTTQTVRANYAFLIQAMGHDSKVTGSTRIYHQREVMHKKAKNKMAKQSRKNNRNR
jgi:hypothetical protein